MRNPGFSKTYIAVALIAAYRIVKFTAVDGEVTPAVAASDKLIGVSDRVNATVINDRLDIWRAGIVEVEYGGTVAQGDPLTSDAVGRAIVAAPAAGVNVRIIGHAEVAGVLGDIGSLLIAPGSMQG
jgi:hypothetical protein